MLTIGSTLAIFVILGISSLALFWAKRINLPHTVLLVLIGIAIGFLSYIPTFSFFGELTLTPQLLFYLLLPTLIFESAYNINARRLVEETPIILVLAVGGLIVSAVVIATVLFYLFAFIGISVPFIVTLLFGVLISATDPVAVLALFKEFGAPRRLSLIFEGESLFNDATAVALFLITLEVARFGFHGHTTITAGVVEFTSMLLGGALFGIGVGGLFAKVVGWTRENEIASITITLVLAHITFILSEIFSEHLHFAGFDFHFSPIIATTVAALLMGNYGRSKIHPRAEEFVEKLWEQLAFWANSLIFILVGVLFVTAANLNWGMIGVVVMTVLVVATARAISIYSTVGLFNTFVKKTTKIPFSWQHLLSWGSLRGALAVTMVLLIPDELSFAHWTLALSPKEFLLSLTVGCIAATLFIKATTIQYFMRKLRLNELTNIEKIEAREARALIHLEVQERIKKYEQRGYIDSVIAKSLFVEHQAEFERACLNMVSADVKEMAVRVLRMYAIGIEKMHLKQLYHYEEVNERVFRRLSGKLQLQLEAIEAGNLAPNMSIHIDKKDIFEHMAETVRHIVDRETEERRIDDLYLYYRAQSILSRKVLKELQIINGEDAKHIFTPEAMQHVLELYTTFRNQSEKKMNEITVAHSDRYSELSEKLARCGINKIEEQMLLELYERQLITPKLYLTLSEELR